MTAPTGGISLLPNVYSNRCESGENAIDITWLGSVGQAWRNFPLGSYKRMDLSFPPVANDWPSGLQATVLSPS